MFQGAAGTCGNRALKLACFKLCIPKDLEGFPRVSWSAGMGCAADRETALSTIHHGCRTTAEEGEGLEGLESRTNEGFVVGLPRSHQDASAFVANNGVHAVHRFNAAVAFQSHLQGGKGGRSSTTTKA